jgi:tetratricopeptide (TPR) repeat protein
VDITSPEKVLTPYDGSGNADEVMTISSSSSSDEWESESETDANPLPLMWNGNTQSDVQTLFLNARNRARDGDAATAEAMLQSAVTGYSYLLGPAHEETNKVVNTLATFYYEHDRLQDAYKVLEKSCRAHVRKLGMQDRRTYQHILNVVELLHGWNKGDDALAFLARAKELAEQGDSRTSPTTGRRRNRSPTATQRPKTAQDSLFLEAARSLSGNPQDPTELEYGLSVARAHISTNGMAVEQLLLATINQCGQDTNKLAIQRLKAWTELLRLYQRSNDDTASITSLGNAHAAFTDVMRRYPWHETTRRKFESFGVIEAALGLIVPFVKVNYLSDAKRMFQLCEEQATATFGYEDERTIWMFITIGLVYQRYRGWDEARHWFEQALNIAMVKYQEDDGIRISLEEAMEVHHFSYINDEGRPYKTIFGVGGLKITPMRLHME